jgi:CRISPR-associated endonuclease Csn1
MTMKKILGLDLGTNSIGWALIEQDFGKKEGKIIGMGSRIIPMDQAQLGDFAKGNTISQTAERTRLRGARRLIERSLLRRERLHRVLNILGFLPDHYVQAIDFEKRLGKFIDNTEPKIPYRRVKNSDLSKYEFIFKNSFNEMLDDFKTHQPGILIGDNGKPRLVPYDWTLYYLRKKALTQKVEKEELGWIIMNFNQKRGYYQLRGEEVEETLNKLIEFHSLLVVDVIEDETKSKKGEVWYSVVLENGWIYRRSSKYPIYDWKGKRKDFIVTTELNDDGTIKTDKEGNEKRSFRSPGEDDWTLKMKKTEHDIIESGKQVGEYIYDTLLKDPSQKIKGKLVRTIERRFYKKELELILKKQSEFHPEFSNEGSYNQCIRELYRHNQAHQLELSKRGLIHLLTDDIIFYQRPLRSQKSTISNCSLEFRKYKSKDGVDQVQQLKVISKSNPIYQEFRMWQWIHNLSIYTIDKDENVTSLFLNNADDYETLYEFLSNRKDIEQKPLLKFFLEKKGIKGKAASAEIDKYRWNYVEDKKYPCNETRAALLAKLEKVSGLSVGFLDYDKELNLWHIIYSVTDKEQYEKAIKKFAAKYELNVEQFYEAFKNFAPFKSEYGAFSEKAIRKLLPLMRIGKYWNWDNIDSRTQKRIEILIDGEYEETISDKVREKVKSLHAENQFQGLPLYLAQYIVYGRHSEASHAAKWNSVGEINQFLKDFKQHSLRNPIVEQIITEALRVVRDIWEKYGNGHANYFDEIHLELGRDMKNPKNERERMTKRIAENENTNQRIKALLAELANDSSVENVRPYSPNQQEILKIYEEGALESVTEIEDDILKISKTAQPSATDLKRYKLWLEQKYRSPYTGAVIPLNKLFTHEYEIEHIIPQSRYFDDSLSNKVICEAAINKLKDNQLGFEFIKNHHGEKVQTGNTTVKVFEVSEYEDFVKQQYAKNRAKLNKLMLEEIPEKMIERQLNDTRYISKYISAILSNIVRTDTNDDGVNAKNLIPVNGKVTAELRHDWGLEDVWNDLILPRFERMNELTGTTSFTAWSENHHKFLPTVPLEQSKGFSKKRIDHRHHALDALVVACATRDHVNLLNNIHADSTPRYDLSRKLRIYEKVTYKHPKTGENITRDVPKAFIKPWPSFNADAKHKLDCVVVSFKQNIRVINKATNYYEKWKNVDGKWQKVTVQQQGVNWAIRKPLHKDTVSGIIQLSRVKVPKGKVITASRKPIDTSFDAKTIESITDTGIQKILLNYLNAKGGDPEIAFTPEGIEEMNKNIDLYNQGKKHQPILKVRIFETGSKFQLGTTGNKTAKYVETAKGTNLFFAIYEGKNAKRNFDTIPLNLVIERLKQGLSPVPETNEKGDKLLFHLSPNDLVYIPSPEELENPEQIDLSSIGKVKLSRIYKMVSATGIQCFFVRHDVASSIIDKSEFSSLNKTEKSIDGIMIKDNCLKVILDRLGIIIKV